jgi:hypothetical protein
MCITLPSMWIAVNWIALQKQRIIVFHEFTAIIIINSYLYKCINTIIIQKNTKKKIVLKN